MNEHEQELSGLELEDILKEFAAGDDSDDTAQAAASALLEIPDDPVATLPAPDELEDAEESEAPDAAVTEDTIRLDNLDLVSGEDTAQKSDVQGGAKFCFSTMPLVRYSREASNRSAAIYRSEQSHHSLEELYAPEQDPTLNEYIARIAIGKAITQSVRGGGEDARRAAERFSFTRRSRRQLRRLRLLNALPRQLRPAVDGLYRAMAWIIKRRGL